MAAGRKWVIRMYFQIECAAVQKLLTFNRRNRHFGITIPHEEGMTTFSVHPQLVVAGQV